MEGIIPTLILLLIINCLSINQDSGVINFGEVQSYKKGDFMSAPGWKEYATLEKDTLINGILFKKGTEVDYDGSGKNRLSSGTLAKDQKIGGATYAANTSVAFYESGKLMWGILQKNTNIKGIKLKGLGYFFENGKIKSGTLAEDITIDNKNLIKNTQFSIDENGKLKNIIMPKEQIIQNIKLPAKTIVYFYETGEVHELTFQEDTNLNGIWFKGGYPTIEVPDQIITARYPVKFYKSGKILEGISAKNQIVQGQKIEKEKKIIFDEDEKILSIE